MPMSMSKALAIARKDAAALWSTPIPFVVGALFQAALGVLFLDQLQGRGQALVQPLFPLAGFLLLVTVPIVTMRAVAEERRAGTLDVLLAIPVRGAPLVVGKWLAAWATVLAIVSPALAYAALVELFADPDGGPVVSGFVGLALLSAVLTAAGVAASSITSSQAVAAMVSFVAAALLWFASSTSGVRAGATLARVSLSERLRSFANGALDGADVGYFVVVTIALLVGASALVRRTRRSLALGAVAMAIAVVGVATADSIDAVADLTAANSLTLTDATRSIVGGVERSVTVTAFLAPDDPERAPAAALLGRYRRANRRITYRLLDPAAAGGELRRLGVDPVLGGVAVEMGGEVDVVPTLTEQDVSGALARLLRGREATVCVASGHGETSVDDAGPEGWSGAAALLTSNGYRVVGVDLLADPAVPAACKTVVLLAPTAPLGDGALGTLRSWLDADGKLLVLSDPSSTVDLTPLTAAYGVYVRRGIVLEGDPESALASDPSAPIVRRYSSGNPVVRRLPPTYFPGVQEVVVDDEALEGAATRGLTVSRLADTSEASYLETEPLGGEFDPAADVAGPITVAAALDASRLDGSRVARTRAVVVGDVDFSTNAYLGEASNSRFLVQAVDWLTLDEELVVLSAHLAPSRPLELTPGRLAYARFVALALLPGLFALAGLAVFVVRRVR